MAEISIIIPVYNQEKYLRRCLDSVIAQTFTDLEVICVNDHSTDSSSEILSEYVKKDSRIKFYENDGKGASAARNFGVNKSHGNYIGFVDSDDYVQPQMYEFMLRAATENDCDLVVCEYEITKEPVSKMFEYTYIQTKLIDYLDYYNYDFLAKHEMVVSGVWSKLIKRELIERCPEFKNYKIGEDTLFCSNLWVQSKKNCIVNLPLYEYFINEKSLTHNNEDWNYTDVLFTRFQSYKALKKNERDTADFYMFKTMILLIRCKKTKILKKKESNDIIKRMYFKCLIPFLMIKKLTIKEKLSHIKSYFI